MIEWIGWIVIMVFAVGLIAAGVLLNLLTGIGGSPKTSEHVIGCIQIAVGVWIGYYGIMHAPFIIMAR